MNIFEKNLKKVYISGGISGIENGNRAAFKKAYDKLKELNFEPVNPHDLFSEEEVSDINNRIEKKEITEEEAWCIFMKRDIQHLVQCEFVAVLPYWESSSGANVELAIAKSLKMPIVRADNLQEITHNINFSINKFQKL